MSRSNHIHTVQRAPRSPSSLSRVLWNTYVYIVVGETEIRRRAYGLASYLRCLWTAFQFFRFNIYEVLKSVMQVSDDAPSIAPTLAEGKQSPGMLAITWPGMESPVAPPHSVGMHLHRVFGETEIRRRAYGSASSLRCRWTAFQFSNSTFTRYSNLLCRSAKMHSRMNLRWRSIGLA